MLTADTLNAKLPYLFGNEVGCLQLLGQMLPEKSVVFMLGIGPAVMALALLEGAGDKELEFVGIEKDDFTGVVHLAEAGFVGRLKAVKGDSNTAHTIYFDNSIDLLLVDACHTFGCVDKDIKGWWPKLKVGGIAFFHDFMVQHNDAPNNGVEQAIRVNKDSTWKEIARVESSILFEKTL